MIFKLLITLFYWTINAMFDVCFTYDLCLGMPSMFYCVVWWCLFQVRNYTVWLLIATRPCLRGWTSTTDPGACQIWGSDRLCQVQLSTTNNIIITSISSSGTSSASKKGNADHFTITQQKLYTPRHRGKDTLVLPVFSVLMCSTVIGSMWNCTE